MTATRAARHRMPGRLVAGGASAVLVAAVALVVGMYAAGSEPQADPLAIGGPGVFIDWLLPFFRLLSTMATVGCAGALLAAVVLLRTDGGPLGVQGRRAIRDASNSAIIWAVSAFAGAIVTAAILLDTPVTLLRLRLDDALGVPEVKALLITGILVVALAIGIRRVQTSSAAGLGVLVAIAALIPPALTAYPRNESYVVLAGAALVIHVIAATTWVGGLAGLVRYGRASRNGLPLVLERYSQVALASSIAVLLSGVISAAGRLAAKGGGYDTVLDVLTSDAYGGLLLAKTVAFVVLIIGGWIHRRQVVTNLIEPGPRFWQLVIGELVVMALAIGLSVALSQTT
ncbi:copper resistance protein D [Kribbella orskensis]|uniref:Copper resistance protein D n=1 Tax=Kribbella orskensis TaxID=2512216 RepID=A0ABY2BB79_9ACTN|nr:MULTISPECIES: CopD family protein [Kribbella]TCN33610.1 copper resistance protein D [Kribbella sp. VKM Ac-2500]TCO13983.1 copper resistance protein D [Kribbella orskensis]